MTIRPLPTLFITLVLLGIGLTVTSSFSDPETLPPISNRIILIRHAEKGFTPDQKPKSNDLTKRSWFERPPWGGGPPGGPRGPPGGKFPNGLSDKGRERAQFLRKLFGNESEYDFGLIFAAPWSADEKETERTYATVAPLASDLGLMVDISCANSDASCIKAIVDDYAKGSDKDILISWKHRELHVIATALGANNAITHYPDERNDIIWIMMDGAIVEKRTQHCPKLDDGRIDEGDPDLAIEKPRQSLLAKLADIMRFGGFWRSVLSKELY
ncbi:uncharacterized protein L201_007860 [Kwoniella dendrophila CBS 6074]|uniref:Phosphoglycerate mutase n=1 Tax=Kwoniella dendrophila CBS 6074 TaxID=1295534 RepID=A0AAX4K732_9TREE